MNAVKGFTLFHRIAHFFEQIQPGPRILPGPGPNADFVDAGIVNCFHHAAYVGDDVPGQMSELRLRSFSLSMNNPVHHFQRAAGSQNLFGNVISLSAAQFRVKFQQAPGQKKRFFQQILRRVFFVAQNFHYVPRFQHRPDAVADRLAAVGNHHVNFH